MEPSIFFLNQFSFSQEISFSILTLESTIHGEFVFLMTKS